MRDNKKKRRTKWNRIEELVNVGTIVYDPILIRRREIYRQNRDIFRRRWKWNLFTTLVSSTSQSWRRIRGKPDNGGILGSNYRETCLLDESLCNHGSIVGRVGGSRDIGESSTRLFFPRAIEAGSCCRWQHLVKGRDGGRRFFGDFETRRKKVKGRKKKWRGREEKDGDEVTGGCKRSTGHRRRTTIQPHHP